MAHWMHNITPEQKAKWAAKMGAGVRAAWARKKAAQAQASPSIRTNGRGRFTALNITILKLDKELATLRERREALLKAQTIIDTTR